MQCNVIADSDSLFRHAVAPVSFNKRRFNRSMFFHLQVRDGNSIHGSLAWERYVPSARHVHAYGCRLAASRNASSRAEGTFQETRRQIYCGVYEVTAAAVRALGNHDGLRAILSVDVIHYVEAGEIAHADLRIVFGPEEQNPAAMKTAIVDRLWNACTGPLTHICDVDRDITPHPRELLESAPAGLYIDARNLWSRIWHFGRFHVCYLLWRLALLFRAQTQTR